MAVPGDLLGNARPCQLAAAAAAAATRRQLPPPPLPLPACQPASRGTEGGTGLPIHRSGITGHPCRDCDPRGAPATPRRRWRCGCRAVAGVGPTLLLLLPAAQTGMHMYCDPFPQVVGLFMAAGFWAACYAVQPSKTVAAPLARAVASNRRGAQAQAAYNAAMAQATATVQRLSWLRAVSRQGCWHAAGGWAGKRVQHAFTGCRHDCAVAAPGAWTAIGSGRLASSLLLPPMHFLAANVMRLLAAGPLHTGPWRRPRAPHGVARRVVVSACHHQAHHVPVQALGGIQADAAGQAARRRRRQQRRQRGSGAARQAAVGPRCARGWAGSHRRMCAPPCSAVPVN